MFLYVSSIHVCMGALLWKKKFSMWWACFLLMGVFYHVWGLFSPYGGLFHYVESLFSNYGGHFLVPPFPLTKISAGAPAYMPYVTALYCPPVITKSYSVSNSTDVIYNTVLYYRCHNGYYHEEQDGFISICMADHTWTNNMTDCEGRK